MDSMIVYIQILLLVVLINKSAAETEHNYPLSLCYNASDVNYENYTSATIQNCGCRTGGTCIRRCCQKGFSLILEETADSAMSSRVCRKRESSNFKVPIYDGRLKLFDEEEHFLIGELKIPNLIRLVNAYPRFYVQKSGTLMLSYCGIGYDLESYCLDEDESSRLIAYVSSTQTCQASTQLTQTNFINISDYLGICQSAADVEYESYTSSVIQNCGCKTGDTCVRKCCQKGFSLHIERDPESGLSYQVCRKNDEKNFILPIYNMRKKVSEVSEKFVTGFLKCDNNSEGIYFINNIEYHAKFYLQKNGSMYYPFYGAMFDNDSYCVDDVDGSGLNALVCSLPELKQADFQTKGLIHMIAKLISIPFLVITLIVYILLPERNLHRHAVMQHVFSLIPGTLFIAIGQYVPILERTLVCYFLGFIVLFFMTSSFFWMNVICVDIWLNFRSLKALSSQGEKNKLFIFSFVYAWGFPVVNVLVAFLLNNYADEEADYYPGLGTGSCFLIEDLPSVFYYFGPIVILMIINIVLFILTAVNIYKKKKEAKMIQQNSDSRRHSNKEDDQFWLYFKLLLMMGVNPVVNTHVIQLISWTTRIVYISYIKDLSHALYGIAIFFVFVCKERTLKLLKEKFGCTCRKGSPTTPLSVQYTDVMTRNESSSSAANKAQNKTGGVT